MTGLASWSDPTTDRLAGWLESHLGDFEQFRSLDGILRLGEGMKVLPYPVRFYVMAMVIREVVEGPDSGDTFPGNLSAEDRSFVSMIYGAAAGETSAFDQFLDDLLRGDE
jgi:hypothetical protein